MEKMGGNSPSGMSSTDREDPTMSSTDGEDPTMSSTDGEDPSMSSTDGEDPTTTIRYETVQLYCLLSRTFAAEREKTSGPKTYLSVRMQEDLQAYKVTLDGLDHVTYVTEVPSSLSNIYTDLHLSAGGSEGVNQQHEVWHLETASSMKTLHDVLIKCRAIFKTVLPGRDTPSSRVLTNGIAGIGKTFSVRKFALDWARGLENQDIDLLVPFSFRELNLYRHEQHSLLSLINLYHPTLEWVTAELFAAWKVGFIFDGLDESRFPLKFQNIDVNSKVFNKYEVISNVKVVSSVGVLLTNLIKGNMLPSALLWITTRPAAANQIPRACVDMVTEIRGFTDPQKEEFFRKMFSDDEKLASTIISHVKTSKSIHIMCHIPVFCWMTATVVEDLVKTDKKGQLPKNLTGMFSHFVSLQLRRMKMKMNGETHGVKRKENKKKRNKKDRSREKRKKETDVDVDVDDDGDVLLKLCRLAFEHLEKGSVMFYREDLEECGLDVNAAALYSVCTEILREKTVHCLNRSPRKVYSFVHLSIQEFLAAVYLMHCFTQENMEAVKTFLGVDVSSLEDFLQRATEKAMKSKNGHLDLFVRFLHGLSLESNQSLLGGLLGQTENSPEEIQRVIKNLKATEKENVLSPDRFINIFHCLMEMNDHSLHQEIQRYLKRADRSKIQLSDSQCSALAFMLLTSEDVLDELVVQQYYSTAWGRNCLVPAVRNCRKALLVGCDLQMVEHEILASALSSNPSHVRELNIGYNNITDPSWVDILTAGLRSPNCQLKILRLAGCNINKTGLKDLLSAVSSNLLQLRVLDLSFTFLQDSHLLQLSALLKIPQCRLQILGLSGCGVTEEGCSVLASAVTSNPSSQLKQVDLNFSHFTPGGSGLKKLTAALETVNVNYGGEHWTKPELLTTHFQRLTLDTNTAHITLSLSENNRKATRDGDRVNSYPDHPDRFDLAPQVLSAEHLTERHYSEMEFDGHLQIGVTDSDIGRIGQTHDCLLGETKQSWSMYCTQECYSVIHNSIETALPIRPSGSNRVAMYVDRPAGTLSFYRVLDNTLTHLYTFQAAFTKPVYLAGFRIYHGATVTLCEDRLAVMRERLAGWLYRASRAGRPDRQAVGTDECVVS